MATSWATPRRTQAASCSGRSSATSKHLTCTRILTTRLIFANYSTTTLIETVLLTYNGEKIFNYFKSLNRFAFLRFRVDFQMMVYKSFSSCHK